MVTKTRNFWIGLCLLNLCIVAFFGFVLRSKILFPLTFLNYRHFLSAHSHFAFGGWAGLALITLLIYGLLPPALAQKRTYQWTLAGIEISSLGMAVFFPFQGYSTLSIIFSSLYILVTYAFAPFFLKDIWKTVTNKTVRLLAVASIISLLVSAIGPLGLSYILLSRSGDSILYRDSVYTFLHFQYNGFFTLAVFAIFFQFLEKKGVEPGRAAWRFAQFLCASVVPALFLALLWHGLLLFYIFAVIGAALVLLALWQFGLFLTQLKKQLVFSMPLATTLGVFALVSFLLKMLLTVGTIIPSLANAVYGARPVIIGFLHLVFLGFVTFFILSYLIEQKRFAVQRFWQRLPFYLFSTGIIANEVVLGLQGLGILFKTNSFLFNWLLWFTSIFLFAGAIAVAWVYWKNKKAAAVLQ